MQKKPIFEVKEDNGDVTPTNEPEVYAQVVKQIKSIGDNVKAQVEEIKTSHAHLKKTLDENAGKMDSLVESKVSKLTEDILTRQEKLEKSLQAVPGRMDDLEALARRIAIEGSIPEQDMKLVEEARDFLWHKEIIHNRLPKHIKDEDVDVAAYAEYKEFFEFYLREGKETLSIMHPDHAKYLTVGSSPDGGILVTPALSNRIVQRVWEMGPWRSLCNIETIGTDAIEIREDLDEAGDDWEGETVATTQGKTPKWNQKRIPVHTQSARPKATQQILDDASMNVEAWLANKVSRKFARSEAAAFVTGNRDTRPKGFTTYTAYTGTAGDGGVTFGQIEQIASGHSSQINDTNAFLNMKYYLVEDYLQNAVWVANRLTVAAIMKLKDGDGQYIWRPGLVEGQPSLLLGLPLRMAKEMPTIAANALAVALADWREAYTIVDRQGITVLRNPFIAPPFIEFYTRRRVGGDVVNFQAIKLMKVSS